MIRTTFLKFAQTNGKRRFHVDSQKMKSKVWVLNEKPASKPSPENFKCIVDEVPACQDGDVIVAAESISVDPYIRYRIAQISLNDVIPAAQVAKVIESKNDAYPVGSYGVSFSGWRTHTRLNKDFLNSKDVMDGFTKLPDFGPLPKSLGLGILGMPGASAYLGFLELCHPKENETVLVNGAAGAVGSAVCQIAKIKGCKVIGFAGSQAKVSWLKELGVDHAFNYKTDNISKSLKSAAPNGIDCYFDNVGGEFTSAVMPHMAMDGRISVCGAISQYNVPHFWELRNSTRSGPFSSVDLIVKELTVRGFYISRWAKQFPRATSQMLQWIQEGKLKYRETITEGFDQLPNAFIGLFDGENIGKSIVNVGSSSSL